MDAGSASSISFTISDISHSRSEIPAARAGDIFTALLIRAKLYQTVYSEIMWQWFSNFLLCAFVSLVDRGLAAGLLNL